MKVPIWKLKPTERPAEPWYAEDLSVKRNHYGKRLNEDEVEKQERRDKVLKEMEDPLRVIVLIFVNVETPKTTRTERKG